MSNVKLWSGCVEGQSELWSGLLYTCGQEQSSIVKTICEVI